MGKHDEPVWNVKWGKDNLDGHQNFFSCSSDGAIINWTVLDNYLVATLITIIPFTAPARSEELRACLTDGVKCISFKPDLDKYFLVGTEEGDIHLCSVDYSSQFLKTYHAHVTPVNNIVWNPFYNNLFLSCASEYRIFLWHK